MQIRSYVLFGFLAVLFQGAEAMEPTKKTELATDEVLLAQAISCCDMRAALELAGKVPTTVRGANGHTLLTLAAINQNSSALLKLLCVLKVPLDQFFEHEGKTESAFSIVCKTKNFHCIAPFLVRQDAQNLFNEPDFMAYCQESKLSTEEMKKKAFGLYWKRNPKLQITSPSFYRYSGACTPEGSCWSPCGHSGTPFPAVMHGQATPKLELRQPTPQIDISNEFGLDCLTRVETPGDYWAPVPQSHVAFLVR